MTEFFLQLERLITAFGDPEYRYLLLEPLILYGIAVGVVMLVVGFFTKAPKLQLAALITVGIASLAHVPYKDARLGAQPRIEQVYKLNSPARVKGFNENTEAWVAATWRFRLLFLCALLAIMIGINRNRFGFGLGVATALLGLMVAKNTLWLHYQDAIAYHPNLNRHSAPIDQHRNISPPVARTEERAPAARATPVAPASSLRATPVVPETRVAPPSPPSRTAQAPDAPRPRVVAPLR